MEELTAKPPDDRVVRLTVSVRHDSHELAHLTMVVGYLTGQSIDEFLHYLRLNPAKRRARAPRRSDSS